MSGFIDTLQKEFSGLSQRENMGQLVLVMLFIVLLVVGYKVPESVANVIDTLLGKILLILIIIYFYSNTNIILTILAIFVALDLIRRSRKATGIDDLNEFAPSEDKKISEFSALNQFPYTLEQEVVSKMAPILQTGSILTRPSFSPVLDDLHDAKEIN